MTTTNTTETPTAPANTSELTVQNEAARNARELFSQAGDLVLDIQDNGFFMQQLQEAKVPYDDTRPEYWAVLREAAPKTLPEGPESQEMNQVMRIVASAPDAALKQIKLKEDRSLDEETRKEYKRVQSEFNGNIRDFLRDRTDLPFDTLTLLLTEAASNGVDVRSIGKVSANMEVVLKGIRTELGFEQKLDALGVAYERATIDEDLIGIDYTIGDIPVDVKSSLEEYLKEAKDAQVTSSYFVKGQYKYKRVVFYPYEADTDYENKTFRVSDAAIELKGPQILTDLEYMRDSYR